MSKRSKFFKKVAGFFVVFLIFFQFSTQVTYAQDAPAIIASDNILEEARMVRQGAFQSAQGAIAMALLDLVNFFAQKAAHEAAIWVASGGNAEKPLFDGRPAGDYFLYAGASMASVLLENLIPEDSTGVPGAARRLKDLDYCAPPDLPLLSLKLGIRDNFQDRNLECSVEDLKREWGGFLNTIGTTISDPRERNKVVLETLAKSFDPRVNEFSVTLNVYKNVLFASQKDAEFSLMAHLKDNGFKGVVNFVTGQTTTPAQMVEGHFARQIEKNGEVTDSSIFAAVANGDVLLSVGMNAASIFTNTLLSEFTKKLADGFFDVGEFPDPFSPYSPNTSDRRAAEEQFRSLLAFRPLKVTNFSMLQEFSTCPSNVRGVPRRLYNCVMDNSFVSAVTRADAGAAMTVKEAVDAGLIKGNWALVPPSDKARDGDINCYTSAFCHSNLVKMRKARIIPVGWEMAAASPANSGNVSLKHVMDNFYNCNAEGDRDEDHPWCKLIDPNWVLKYPATQCRTLAYGQILETASVDTRAQECVDIESCIEQDANGNCIGGYGYCVQEKNAWQFRGDACPAHYASCLTFNSPEGGVANFLTTSVDQDGCGADNAGCYWYATTKVDTGDGFDWPVVNDVAVADASPSVAEERTYFTSAVQNCSAQDGGCTELIPRTDAVSLNIIQNPGFERTTAQGYPHAWHAENFAFIGHSTDGSESFSGSVAVASQGALIQQYGLVLSQSNFYTLSFYARQQLAGISDSVFTILTFEDENGVETPNLAGTSFSVGCTTAFGSDTIAIDAVPGSEYQRYTCTFTSPTFADASSRVIARLGIAGGRVWVDNLQLQQSESASFFQEGYGVNVPTQRVQLKLPPAYLGCTGSATDPDECSDYAQVCTAIDAGCSLYTPSNGDLSITAVASQGDRCDDVCTGYDTYKQEPTLYEPEGAFPVHFIPETAQTCNQSAVGCDEFTNLETEETEYFTFIRACVTEEQAGRNTNGDNEAVFYTWEGSDTSGYQLKTWHLLESNLGNGNYTHASGFQELGVGSAPCVNWVMGADGITCQDDISAIGLNTACDEHADIFTNPDCREFYDVDGNIHYREWKQTVTVNNVCVTYRKTDLVGLGSDLNGDSIDDGRQNCEGFGGYFNTSTNECLYYGHAAESELCSESENGCREYTGGQGRNSRVVLEEVFESGTVSNWAAASAAGITYSNDSIATEGHSLLSEGQAVWTHFYDHGSACDVDGGCDSGVGTLGGSCTVIEGQRYCGMLANQLIPDKTYTISFWAKGAGTVSVGFDMNAVATGAGIDIPFAQDISLTPEWRRYTFGPINATARNYPNFGAGTTLAFVPGSGATAFYIDNVVLREGEGNIAVIKDSWVTPAVCDMNQTGTVVPQFQLGCQEYTNQNGQREYFKSFSRLCDEDKVGCTPYYATAESTEAHAKVYNATCQNVDLNGDGAPDTVTSSTACHVALTSALTAFNTSSEKLCDITPGNSSCQFDLDYYIPLSERTSGIMQHILFAGDAEVVDADYPVYAVYDPQFACSSGATGCQEVGRPVFSADRSVVESWETQYLLNKPSAYQDILCRGNELFCEEWSAGSNGTWYFKNPQKQTCEYRTDVSLGGTTYSGWFRTGTNNLCYGTGSCSENSAISCSLDSDCASVGAGTCTITTGSFLSGGTDSGLWKNGDGAYSGWVGTCSQEFNGCSAYLDPMEHSSKILYGESEGKAHYYIDNRNLEDATVVSSQRCNGQVSQKEGCALFNDTGNTQLTSNASASYIASVHADTLFGGRPESLVDPIDCSNGGQEIVTPSGERVNLCAQRCRYITNELDSQANFARGSAEYFSFAGSCVVNDDCATLYGDNGDPAEGICASEVTIGGELVNVPLLENDTNRIVKVNRDRVCSEWLACASERTVWDAATGEYRSICDSVDLCTAHGGEGDVATCRAWDRENPAVVLDADFYTSRDVSWYGAEYSGYAIPDIIPVQHLTQVDISSGMACSSDPALYRDQIGKSAEQKAAEMAGIACSSHSFCDSTVSTTEGPAQPCVPDSSVKDYRLVYSAGACDLPNGSACSVGYCSGNGNACASDAQCQPNGGSCIAGGCFALGGSCSTDSDCSGDEVCSAGTCSLRTGDCSLDLTCGTPGSTCIVSKSFKDGSCYNGSCVLAPDGNAFEIELAEQSICRAHPEANAPFGNAIVSDWNGSVSTKYGVTPQRMVSGYEQANYCAPGEACVCSYQKVSITGADAYLDLNSKERLEELGLCSGGSRAGALCDVNAPTNVCGDGGECKLVNRVDTMYGLTGYCLERDNSIYLQGDPSLNACLTWLPVDQLLGSTDLYAKFKSAGYQGGETEMCANVRPYADIQTSVAEAGDIGVDWTTSNANIACMEQVSGLYCPPGHFMLRGRNWSAHGVNANDPKDNFAHVCRDPILDRNDTPFVCVPENSYRPDGSRCEPPNPSVDYITLTSVDRTQNGKEYTFDVYFFGYQTGSAQRNGSPNDLRAFSDAVIDLSECVAKGVEVDFDFTGQPVWTFGMERNREAPNWSDGIWRNYNQNANVYLGCKESVVVDDGLDTSSAPYTDRLFTGNHSFEVNGFTFDSDTSRFPFGRTLTRTQINSRSVPERTPAILAACRQINSAASFVRIALPGALDACAAAMSPIQSLDDPEGRALSLAVFNVRKVTGPSFYEFIYSQTQALNNIKSLFAKSLSYVRFDDGRLNKSVDNFVNGEAKAGDNFNGSIFAWDERANGKPPTIWSLDMDNCYGVFCQEGVMNKFSVNGSDSTDHTATGGLFKATINFYMAADKDQLPIRRVIVDWMAEKDGKSQVGSPESDNFYKNARGLQDGKQTEQICDEDSEWGKTAESCDPNYMVFRYDYTCTDADVGHVLEECTVDENGNINSPCRTTDGRCAYQPRVHIMDNWGWCTGTCTGGAGGDGCFGGDWMWSPNANDSSAECSYQRFPDNDPIGWGNDPWIYYDGIIYVDPS